MAITGAKVRVDGAWVDIPGGGEQGEPGAPGQGVPAGGTTGQLLAKNSATDYDTEWVDAPSGGGGAVSSVNGETGVVVLTAAEVGAAATSHTHGGGDITSGTVAYARLPVGTAANTIAAGNDSRLTNARTPTAHAASHEDGGSDELTLDGSQIGTGTVPFARLPTGTSSSQVSVGNHVHSYAAPGDSPVVKVWNEDTSTYDTVTGANIYVGGDADPTVNDGDIWIHEASA